MIIQAQHIARTPPRVRRLLRSTECKKSTEKAKEASDVQGEPTYEVVEIIQHLVI